MEHQEPTCGELVIVVDVGAVISASFPLDVDHTPPQFCINSYWAGSSGFIALPQGSANWSGGYHDNLSGVVSMTVNGYHAVLTPGAGNGGTWVIPDSSGMMLPDFDITVTDAAGNDGCIACVRCVSRSVPDLELICDLPGGPNHSRFGEVCRAGLGSPPAPELRPYT